MKQIKFWCICCIAVFLLTACGEKKIIVKGADGTEYESYQECCTAQDYEAAHKYLAKMQNNVALSKDYNNAKEFVFKQEALFLMSQGDETAKKRIIYLLKEEGENNDHIAMLIDLAIDNDDEDFVKTLTRHYKYTISTDILRKIVEYLYLQKGEENLDFVTTLLNSNDENGLLFDAAVKKGDKNLVVSLAQKLTGSISLQSYKNVVDFLSSDKSSQYKSIQNLLSSKVPESKDLLLYALDRNMTNLVNRLSAEYVSLSDNNVISKLASAKNNKYDEIVIGLITAKESFIAKKPKMGFVTFYGSGQGTSDFEDMCKFYSNSVKGFNGICQNILGIAINNKNQRLAQRVVSKFKSDIHVDDIGFVDNVHYRYKISIDNNMVNEAKATYSEAVKSGAFK